MRTHRRINWDLWLGGAVMVAMALLFGACLIKADMESIRQENTTSVPSEQTDTRTERALESMARAFHGWQR